MLQIASIFYLKRLIVEGRVLRTVLGPRIELFCSYHPGCPRAEISWTKDGLPLQERGRDSGLYSTVRIYRNGKLVIEVGN